MAGCSKNIEPASPDPDAWIHDLSLPVPIQFGAQDAVQTKAGGAISTAADMKGKKFGFYSVSDKVSNLTLDNGLGMPQNISAECELIPGSTDKVRFTLDGGPYYYPTTSNSDNYSFYGYHAHVSGQGIERASKDSLFLVVEVGETDILWGKAVATPEWVEADQKTYEGFNARYVRKTLKHPTMEFKHLTASVNFSAEVKASAFSQANPGADAITITKVTIKQVDTKAVLRLALGQDAIAAGINQEEWEGTLRLPADRTKGDLTATGGNLNSLGSFFILPTESINVELEYTVGGKPFSYKYELIPTVKEGDKAGQQGFFAGYQYSYKFVVYTPERISIEATVKPYESAFGDEPETILPDED